MLRVQQRTGTVCVSRRRALPQRLDLAGQRQARQWIEKALQMSSQPARWPSWGLGRDIPLRQLGLALPKPKLAAWLYLALPAQRTQGAGKMVRFGSG